MAQQTAFPSEDLVDVSGLTLRDVEDLGDSAIAHALRDALDTEGADVEATAAFDNI